MEDGGFFKWILLKKLSSMKKLLLAVFVLIGIAAFSQSYSSSTSGSWTTNSTWVGGSKPSLSGPSGQLSSDVTISVGHTVTLSGNLTVKNGTTLTVRGRLVISASGNVDFQNGSIILVESGGSLELYGLTNSNNSTNVTIHGSLIVNGNYTAGTGASLSGNGSMEVSGTSSGSGTTFGVVLTCDDCTVASGGVITDAIIDGSQTNQSAPIEPYYRYTYSQQIYYQSEINEEGNITSLAFEYNGYTTTNFDVEIYLGHTTRSTFTTTSNNWISYSDLTKVYDGTYSVSNSAGWYSITFDTPFYYNNSDNLVVAVHEKSYSYQSSSTEFYTDDGGAYRVLTYYDDGTNPNPASPPYYADYRSVWVPSLKLTIEPAGTPLPIELLYFNGYFNQDKNILSWSTLSEKNNDYFTLEKSNNGSDWEIITIEAGAGNSSTKLYYSLFDYNVDKVINYYRLKQTDYDGKFKYSDIISIDNREWNKEKEVIKLVNILGQEIDNFEYYIGLYIICYSDGSSEKMIKSRFD